MAGTVGAAGNNVAALQAQAAQLLGQLGGGAALGGGAGAAAPGAQGAAGAAGAQGQQQAAVPQAGVTARGVAVQIVADPQTGKPKLATPTGLDEKVELLNPQTGARTGQVMLFNAAGAQVRNFEIAARQPIKVDLDQRVGIASGISNLSRIVAQRQERLKSLQEALAQDSNETGNTNQLDIQQLVQEQQVSEHISNLNHKIYESVQNAIAPWLR